MNRRQATESDFKYGIVVYDKEGNEFVIKDKYDEGIYNTNKGNVIFTGEARYYEVNIE
jgi:hypothetical protein